METVPLQTLSSEQRALFAREILEAFRVELEATAEDARAESPLIRRFREAFPD